MILDGLLLFDTASAKIATTDSDNVIDLQNFRDMGVGDNPAMKVMVTVTTAYATTDAGTLTITVQGSTDNSTYSIYASSRALTASEMTAGRQLFPIDLPARGPGDAPPRYLKLIYTVENHFTAGSVTSALVLDNQQNHAYPAGINVLN